MTQDSSSSVSQSKSVPSRVIRLPVLLIALAMLGAVAVTTWNRQSSNSAYLEHESIIAWQTDYQEALDQSQASGKPVVALFTADWCPPCQSLKKSTLNNPQVAQTMEADFVPLYMDMTKTTSPVHEQASRLGVQGIPTMVIMDDRGNMIKSMSGVPDPSWMMNWLSSQ